MTLQQGRSPKRIHSILPGLRKAIAASMERSYQAATPFLSTAALMGIIGHPLFYLIWVYIFPQPYENLALRLVASALAAPLLMWRRWPSRWAPFLPMYFHLVVIYHLPFLFLYFLVQNGFSQIWILSAIGAAFVLTFLIEWRGVAVIYLAGAVAWAIFSALAPAQTVPEGLASYIAVMLFPLSFGAIFSYQLAKSRQAQQRLERRIRRISTENTRVMQEQNRLFSLFLSNSIVARLQQFQSQFGLEKAISMITSREQRFCGIMEADVRNFTQMFARETEHDVAQLISRCFSKITTIGQDLSVIKPVGDALFIYTDDTSGRELAVTNVLALAILFVQSLEEVNAVLEAEGGRPLNFGIAVHAGEASYGNLASETLIDPTIIGVNVNLTARLEELTKEPVLQAIIGPNAILLTDAVADYASGLVDPRRLTSLDLHSMGLKVRDFPDISRIYALSSAAAASLYDIASRHVATQRKRLSRPTGQVEASTYHGVPYYFEMQGAGPDTNWTVLIDFGTLSGQTLTEYADLHLRDLEYDLKEGDTLWLVLSTAGTPGAFDEADVEARVHQVIRDLEPVGAKRRPVPLARA